MIIKIGLLLVSVCLVLAVAFYGLQEAPNEMPPSPTGATEPEKEPLVGTPGAALPRVSPEQEEERVAARIEAIRELENVNEAEALGALARALADTHREIKEAALQALAEKEGPDATQVIRLGLDDPDHQFRLEIIELLAHRGDRDALRKAKSDPHAEVRERAADLLGSTER